jgi:hypothetical protein
MDKPIIIRPRNIPFSIIINILLFFFYFLIASVTPYVADDFRYKINPLNFDMNIKLLYEIFNFQIWHYLNWGGRIVAHTFVQLFLVPTKLYFNIINAVVQTLLINTIFFYAFNKLPGNNKKDASLLLFINLLLFLGFYKYSGMSIYLTSTINYTWMHLFTLLYFLPHWNYFINGKDSEYRYIFLFLGIIIGCTNEHVFIAQLFFFLTLIILKKKSIINKLPKFYYHSFIGIVLGGIILILSPGNIIRANTTNFKLTFNNIIDYIIYDFTWVINYIKPFWLIIIPLYAYYYYFIQHDFNNKKPYLLIISIGIISSAAMAVSPSYHSGTNLFLYICMIIFVLSLIKSSLIPNFFIHTTLIFSIVLFSYLYSKHSFINEYFLQTEKSIINQKENGNEHVVVKKINIQTNRLINYYAIETDSILPRNKNISRYYKLKSIRSGDQ